MDQSCALSRITLFGRTVKTKGNHLSAQRLHAHCAAHSGRRLAVLRHVDAFQGRCQRTAGSRLCRQRDQQRHRRSWSEGRVTVTLSDHPRQLICSAVTPHAGYQNMRGPTRDGVLLLATNRLHFPDELIAEMYRLRWFVKMFFRAFKQLLGCGRLSLPSPTAWRSRHPAP